MPTPERTSACSTTTTRSSTCSEPRASPRPDSGPPLEALLADHPEGSKWRRRLRMSAWDVIRHEFESPYVRSFMLWQAFQTLVPVDAAGSGPLAYSIVFGRQRRGWTIPRGGSGELTEALVRSIVDDGGTVLCDRVVSRLLLEDGRCVGVETEAGETFSAREAVVSTIHVKHLVEMAPADAWGEDFVYGVETYDVGLSGFAVYMAATRPPVFETPAGDRDRGLGRARPAGRRSCSITGAVCATASTTPTRPGCWSPPRPSPTRRGRPRVVTRSSSSAARAGGCRRASRAGISSSCARPGASSSACAGSRPRSARTPCSRCWSSRRSTSRPRTAT